MLMTQRIVLSALFAVPFMLGNWSCDSTSHDGQPDSSGGTLGKGHNDGATERGPPVVDGGNTTCTSCPGPAPGAPNYLCTDGTTGGPVCAPDAAGVCGWSTRSCPAEMGHERKRPTCEDLACGAPPGASPRCADGSDAHPSCLKRVDDSCAWTFFCGAVDAPDGGSDPGQFCGGIAGIDCADGLYCNFGSTCGAADQGGQCDERPQVCPTDFSPVCGCDHSTYGNRCAAAATGVSVSHAGSCAPKPCDKCPEPMPGAPNYLCKDGTHMGGPACVAEAGEACGWQFLKCPEEQ